MIGCASSLTDKTGTVDGDYVHSWKASLERDQPVCRKAPFNLEHVILGLPMKFFQVEKYSYISQIRAGLNNMYV